MFGCKVREKNKKRHKFHLKSANHRGMKESITLHGYVMAMDCRINTVCGSRVSLNPGLGDTTDNALSNTSHGQTRSSQVCLSIPRSRTNRQTEWYCAGAGVTFNKLSHSSST